MFVRINQALDASRAKREENDKGFTLIELLVVVLIIGILAAIAIPVYIGQQKSAQDAAAKSDITNAKLAITAYYAANPISPVPTITTPATTLATFGWPAGSSVAATPASTYTDFDLCIVSGSGAGTFKTSESTAVVGPTAGTC